MKKLIIEAIMMNPVGSSSVSSPFGEKRTYETHPGVDIPVPSGTSIKAPLDGVVKTANINHNRQCGGTIDIDYGNGFWSRFCHCRRIDVKEGDIVKRGQVVGLTGGKKGETGAGNSGGPHLHFTLKKDGKNVDPMKYIDKIDAGTSDFSMSAATQSSDGDSETNWDDFFKKGKSKILPKTSGIEDPLLKAILSPLEKALNLQSEMKEVYSVISEDYSLQNGDFTTPLEYAVKKGKKVLSPEEGVVKQINTSYCKNSVLLQHTIQSKKFYTLFCNVERVGVDYGDNIRKGSEIGIASENTTVNLLDSSKGKVKFKNVTRFKDIEKEKGITGGDKFKIKNDPLLDLALKPLEKVLNFPEMKTSSEADTIEPYKWIKWVQKNTTSKNESVQRNITKIKKLL